MAILLVAWLEYIHYGIFIDEKNLKIKKGLIAEEDTGVPYRRIKDVKIERSLLDQILGMSDIVVTILGSDESRIQKPVEDDEDDVIFLPAIEKETALHIQDMILKKAQVEQIDVLSGHANIINRADNPDKEPN